MPKKKKSDVPDERLGREISNRLLVAGQDAARRYMEQFPMDRDGDDSFTFTPTAWHRLRSAYMAGFTQGSGSGFQEGLSAKKGI